MKRRLILRPEAQRDAEEAALWYDLQRSGLGDRFIRELRQLLDRITEYPLHFPRLDLAIRRGHLQHFPYSVYFAAEDEIVVILAVLHQRRHPDTWKRRVGRAPDH
jgi:toxin ParE1/3/4